MKKMILLPLIASMLVFFIFNINVHAFKIANKTGGAYIGGGEISLSSLKCTINNDSDLTINELIVRGSSFFFQSSSQMNDFFKNIKLFGRSGQNYKVLQKSLNTAFYHMEKARASYLQLKNLASLTPYNQEILSKIIDFDYDSFQQMKGFLFPMIFARVKNLLRSGDVTGIYTDLYHQSGKILDSLLLLKKDIDADIFPEFSTLGNVDLNYTDMRLFGQYVAEVFSALNK